jgi:membrane associated rhomboid family serine protease
MDIRPLPEEAFTQAALKRDRRRLETALFWAALTVATLWLVSLAETIAGTQFTALGLAPREALGLLGILGAPLVHGSIGHLVANSLPTFVLVALGMYAVPRATFKAIPLIWIVSGVLVWLFGRESLHIGASGVTHGLMSFLFLLGALRRDRVTLAIAFVVFFLYGSMLYGFLPGEAGISFEYHGGGLVAGVLAAVLYRKLDPPPPQMSYSWETEPELDEDPGRMGTDPLEPPAPIDVKPIWDGPTPPSRGVVIPFPLRRPANGDDEQEPPRTLH